MLRFKKFYGLVAGLMLASLMVACGDATATPAPAATTAAPGTTAAVATTVAPVATTAAPATSAAATTVATTAAATSAAVTTSVAPSTVAATTAATSTAIAEYDAGGLKVIDPRPNYKAAPAGKKGGNLNLGDTSEAKSLHPFLTSDTVSTGWQQYLYEAALVETDVQTGLPAPAFRVVSALKVSQDKQTYTFTLKDGIKWSDGQPIVAEDYAWTYAQVLKPENKWPYIEDYADTIDTVTAPDAKTVVFKFKQPEVYALSNAGLEPLPKRIWDGKDWGDSTKNPEIDNPSVVSGPWKLKEWKRGQYVIFARNDASTIYPVPLLDTITIQIVKDSKVLFQKFKAGEIDVTGVSPTDYDEAKKAPNTTLLEYFRPSFGFTYTGFNFRKTYLQDIELRKALAYATLSKL